MRENQYDIIIFTETSEVSINDVLAMIETSDNTPFTYDTLCSSIPLPKIEGWDKVNYYPKSN